jgi:hypothetical protein
MSKKKKSGNKVMTQDSILNLVTALINLVVAILLLLDHLSS